MLETIKPSYNLAKRARYLLEDSQFIARDVRATEVLQELKAIGRIALIGSAVRALLNSSLRHFDSDLDFVVEVKDSRAYQRLIDRYSPQQNNFGGYRLSLHGIDIDFWDAQCSWAHTQGHKCVRCLEDVVETTFFNVDAILYIVNERRIEAKLGTLEAIKDGYLDINLYPNPNPLGATLRALRRMCQHNMRASNELVAYIADQLDHFGWDRMSALEKSAYPTKPVLESIAGAVPQTGSEFQARYFDRSPWIIRLGLSPLG